MSIEAEKGMCRHDARAVCWMCSDQQAWWRDARAVCWMCSDQQAWWRDARIKAGYGAEPPNAPVVTQESIDLRRRRFMQRKWSRDYRARRRAGAA